MITYAKISKELDNLRADLEMIRSASGINVTDIKVERTLPLMIDICDMQVGDRITIPMGKMLYTATAVDERDGDIYFLFDQLLDSRPIDSRGNFNGTFDKSELFAWLNSEFKEQLPEWIRSRLNHNITLPTVTQIFGTSDEWAIEFFDINVTESDEQFECMKDVKNRLCTFENDTKWYWLCTKRPSSGPHFAGVNSHGVAYSYGAGNACYVRPLLKVRKR